MGGTCTFTMYKYVNELQSLAKKELLGFVILVTGVSALALSPVFLLCCSALALFIHCPVLSC